MSARTRAITLGAVVAVLAACSSDTVVAPSGALFTGGGPPPTCDFITLGRLVAEVGETKVVISGNAGDAKGDGILAEFHVEVNGDDNHVASPDTYGPVTSGPLLGLTNARVTTGTAKNGNFVELYLWDGGEPGKGTDRVHVTINGVAVLGLSGPTIDQGNMQYHNNCRGPG